MTSHIKSVVRRPTDTETVQREFGEEHVRYARGTDSGGQVDFPVIERHGSISSSLAISQVLAKVPGINEEYVLIAPEDREAGKRWLQSALEELLRRNEGV